MPAPRPWAASPVPPPDGSELLERAVGYTRGCLQLVAGADLTTATPCPRWDLAALLRHMDDSLAAFTDAAEIGYVDVVPVPGTGTGTGTGGTGTGAPVESTLVVDRLKRRACAVLGAWAQLPGPADVAVGDRRLHSDVLAAAGALEIAVHGWDVARACGEQVPLPGRLAVALLDVVPLLVSAEDRPAPLRRARRRRGARRTRSPAAGRPRSSPMSSDGTGLPRTPTWSRTPSGCCCAGGARRTASRSPR